jgi:rhodanese-related sulfurtransferase
MCSFIVTKSTIETRPVMPSPVAETAPASPQAIRDRYAVRLSFETDCWDVHEAIVTGANDFVLLDVRASRLYEAAHVPTAINLPRGEINERSLAAWPRDTLFVVYCAGPHCNGADKAALRLGELGRRVKVMIGGVMGWVDEGFTFAANVLFVVAARCGLKC